MALPGLKDLLPDHLFHNPSRVRTPPPPSSILQHVHPLSQPLYPGHDEFAPYPYPHPRFSPVSTYAQSQVHAVSLAPASRPPKRPYNARQANIHGSAALSGVHSSTFRIVDSSNTNDTSVRHHTINAHDFEIENEDDNEEEGDGGKRKHACPMCGKRFNRPSSLRIHLNTHSGEKPYTCPFPGCNRCFNVSSNMRRHYRNHARRAPPPLPLDDVLAQAQAAQAQVQAQLHMQSQTQMQQAFSVEPPFHVQQRQTSPTTERSPSMGRMIDADGFWDGDGTGNVVRGAEAAARAARKASVSSAVDPRSTARQGPSAIPQSQSQVQYEYPYPRPPSRINSGAYLHVRPQSQPRTYVAYPQQYSKSLDPPANRGYTYPTGPAVPRYRDEHGYESGYGAPSGFGAPRAPAPSTYGSIPASSSRAYRAEREARYSIPPTPPYTNEAVLSPPAYARGAISSSSSGYAHVPAHEWEQNNSLSSTYYRDDLRNGIYANLGNRRASAHGNSDADETWRRGGGSMHASSFTRSHADPLHYSKHAASELEARPPRYASYPTTGEGYEYEDRYPFTHARHEYFEERKETIRGREDSGYGSSSRYADSQSRAGSASSTYGREQMHLAAGVRQQPSPDTPSLHVSALHSDHSCDVVNEQQHDVVRTPTPAEYEPNERETTRRGEQGHARGLSRSSLQLHELIHPYEEPLSKVNYAPRDDASASTPGTQSRCTSGELFSISPTSLSSTSRKSARTTAKIDECVNDSELKIKTSVPAGRTPGAAPPPPYPLYTLPPPAACATPELEPEPERILEIPVRREGRRGAKRKRRG